MFLCFGHLKLALSVKMNRQRDFCLIGRTRFVGRGFLIRSADVVGKISFCGCERFFRFTFNVLMEQLSVIHFRLTV